MCVKNKRNMCRRDTPSSGLVALKGAIKHVVCELCWRFILVVSCSCKHTVMKRKRVSELEREIESRVVQEIENGREEEGGEEVGDRVAE